MVGVWLKNVRWISRRAQASNPHKNGWATGVAGAVLIDGPSPSQPSSTDTTPKGPTSAGCTTGVSTTAAGASVVTAPAVLLAGVTVTVSAAPVWAGPVPRAAGTAASCGMSTSTATDGAAVTPSLSEGPVRVRGPKAGADEFRETVGSFGVFASWSTAGPGSAGSSVSVSRSSGVGDVSSSVDAAVSSSSGSAAPVVADASSSSLPLDASASAADCPSPEVSTDAAGLESCVDTDGDDGDASAGEESGADDESAEVSATATPGVPVTAAPMPRTTASAPTRPMYFALPIAGPPDTQTPSARLQCACQRN